jgi:uncharacterized protein
MSAVVNATPLIALAVVDRLDLLPLVFGEVLVPTGVYAEVVISGHERPEVEAAVRERWLRVMSPALSPAVEPVLLGLDQGELQVLLLAREINADWVVIDEKLGRRVARAMRLPVKGTLGVLLAAYYAGRFPAEDCRRAVSAFTTAGIRLSPSLIEWFLGQLTL